MGASTYVFKRVGVSNIDLDTEIDPAHTEEDEEYLGKWMATCLRRLLVYFICSKFCYPDYLKIEAFASNTSSPE